MLPIIVSFLVFFVVIYLASIYETPYAQKKGERRMKYLYKDMVKGFIHYSNAEITKQSYNELEISAESKEMQMKFTLQESPRNLYVKWTAFLNNYNIDQCEWIFSNQQNQNQILSQIKKYVDQKIIKISNSKLLLLPSDLFNYCKLISLKSPLNDNSKLIITKKMKFTSLLYCCSIYFIKRKYINKDSKVISIYDSDQFVKELIAFILIEAEENSINPLDYEVMKEIEDNCYTDSHPLEFHCLSFLQRCAALIQKAEKYKLTDKNNIIQVLASNYFQKPGTFFIYNNQEFDDIKKRNDLSMFLKYAKESIIHKLP